MKAVSSQRYCGKRDKFCKNGKIPAPEKKCYNESLTYDKNGNITTLDRYGDLDTDIFNIKIDELTYAYDAENRNQLLKVSDDTDHPIGFSDDAGAVALDTTDDYAYDDNGNLISDENKEIDNITYNHLNLPLEISFASGAKINYLYDATGRKVKKTVDDTSDVTVTDYISGFQYETINSGPTELKFFPHAEGYVNNTVIDSTNVYRYVFQYKDHLGNVRINWTEDLIEEGELVILEENHYYPFGMKHAKYNADTWGFIKGGIPVGIAIGPVVDLGYQYKFQGQERQDELGLNWDSFKWRNYDYAIGRFMSIDPLAEKYAYQSTYNFAENKVIDHRELEGLEGIKSQEFDAKGKLKNHVIEKNVVVLLQGHKSVPKFAPGTSDKKIKRVTDRIERQNKNIDSKNSEKVAAVKSELNTFFSGAKNTAGESVEFKFNVTGQVVEDTSTTTREFAFNNGLKSSQLNIAGGTEIAMAAVLTTDTPSTPGLTTGNYKMSIRSDQPIGNGALAHEVMHALMTLPGRDSEHAFGGLSEATPTGVGGNITPSAVDQIINDSYKK